MQHSITSVAYLIERRWRALIKVQIYFPLMRVTKKKHMSWTQTITDSFKANVRINQGSVRWAICGMQQKYVRKEFLLGRKQTSNAWWHSYTLHAQTNNCTSSWQNHNINELAEGKGQVYYWASAPNYLHLSSASTNH